MIFEKVAWSFNWRNLCSRQYKGVIGQVLPDRKSQEGKVWAVNLLPEYIYFFRMTIYATDRSNNNAIIEGFKVYGFLPKSGYHFQHPTPMGSIARFQCDAGNRWNRRIDNFDLTTHDVTCQVYIPFQNPAQENLKNFQLLRQTAHGQGIGQPVPTSPHARTQPPSTTRTRSRPPGPLGTPPTSRPGSLGSAKTDGT